MPDRLLSGEHIRQYLTEVAEAVDTEGPRPTIVVVGGSLLAWHGIRDATRDVDSIRPVGEALKEAAALVATRHDLAPRWLNDMAATFAPAELREEDCSTLLDHPRLLVLGPPLRFVFAMKLYRGQAADWDDLVAMWPHCGFASPEDAVDLFWRSYPHAPEDEYLINAVREIADRVS